METTKRSLNCIMITHSNVPSDTVGTSCQNNKRNISKIDSMRYEIFTLDILLINFTYIDRAI